MYRSTAGVGGGVNGRTQREQTPKDGFVFVKEFTFRCIYAALSYPRGSLATVKVNVPLVPTCQLSKGCCCCPRCVCLEAVILGIAFPLDSHFVYYVCFKKKKIFL
ncbi:60 kDa heat shock protein, mitochondrial [Platysternon megacephalum]|uniref:60 kDa heat shock protein, mitochondrial n=1 Tax=Platysternon megacephalum TaxID=55544 RepID=A0A4D9EWY6_9SAUR|nr:60 kDa heat shock protein, mitochondrial [Platysternon megacephalum]